MRFFAKRGRVRSGALALAAVLAVSACQDQETSDPLLPTDFSSDEAKVRFETSSFVAESGSRVTLSLRVTEGDIAALQGYIQFDPTALRYVGQLQEGTALSVLNTTQAEAGVLRLAAVDHTGLDRAALLGFEVLRGSYAPSLRFQGEYAYDLRERSIKTRFDGEVVAAADLPSAADARAWSIDEMALRLDPTIGGSRPAQLPGASNRYGDATQDNLVNVLDALYAANTVVGNPGFECIIGTGSPNRDCVAVNVRPENAPGLGGPGDPCPPGIDVCGRGDRTVNVLDVLPIRLEAVGQNQNVVGEIIPQESVIGAGDTVIIAGPLTITGTRTFSADSLYILRGGTMTVGVETGLAGEIQFQPGTRFESDSLSAIFVTRNGRIIADGTQSQPIRFTCELQGPVRAQSCWGGIFIAGNAVVNEAQPGLPAAPAIPGRNPSGGGAQREGEGGAVNFGGLNDADSSGVLRYVVVEYGGRTISTNNELNNVTIGACGSGTVIDYLQVSEGSDDGLEIFGGRCNVKHLLASGNDDDQFDFSFGYDGRVQFQVIHHDSLGSDKGHEVDNTETAATYNNAPRTVPDLANITFIGGTSATSAGLPSGAANKTALHYRRGAGGHLQNILLVRYATHVLGDNVETCNLIGNNGPAGGGLGTGDGWTFTTSVAIDPAIVTAGTCAAQLSAHLTAGRMVATGAAYAGQLKAPFFRALPDYRPVGSGVTVAGQSPTALGAPWDPATYYGGVAPAGSGGSIPWYAGWSVGF